MLVEGYARFEVLVVEVVVVKASVGEGVRKRFAHIHGFDIGAGSGVLEVGVCDCGHIHISHKHCAACKSGRSPSVARSERELERYVGILVVCAAQDYRQLAPIVEIFVGVLGVYLGEACKAVFLVVVLGLVKQIHVRAARGGNVNRLYPQGEAVELICLDSERLSFNLVVAFARGVYHIRVLVVEVVGQSGICALNAVE